MNVQEVIELKIKDALSPSHLSVINESYMHSVPPGSESHFKLVIVTDFLTGISRIKRHQTIIEILKDELEGPLHALSMETLTCEEWEQKGGLARVSPECIGGQKSP